MLHISVIFLLISQIIFKIMIFFIFVLYLHIFVREKFHWSAENQLYIIEYEINTHDRKKVSLVPSGRIQSITSLSGIPHLNMCGDAGSQQNSHHWRKCHFYCPACRTTLIATRFRVAVICPIIQVPHCIRVFFYFVWFVFINHIFQFYHELCTYCNILDIYLS